MRLRAYVSGPGLTKHFIGTLVADSPQPVEQLPQPTMIEIVEDTHGFLYLLCDQSGESFADLWFETLDEAKKHAEFEFHVTEADWESPKVSGLDD